MEQIVFVISDFVIPIVMIFWGGRHRKKFPTSPAERGAYRSKRARRTKKSWAYAQKRFAQLWMIFGGALLVINLILRFTLPFDNAQITLLNLVPSIAAMLIPVFLVERELSQKIYDRIDEK